MKIVMVLLTWQRLSNLKNTITLLNRQSYKSFDIHISNANLDKSPQIDQTVQKLAEHYGLKIKVTHDGNDYSCFRRFFIGREYAQKGYDAVMFLDDDINIPPDYVKRFVDAYEPQKYLSAYTWTFQENGDNYYTKRKRVYDNGDNIKYGGAGVSMVDASVFLNDGLINAPEHAYQIDDLWMSYYCDHVLGWDIKYVDIPKLLVGGGDSVALYRKIKRGGGMDKAAFLRELVAKGWKV